MRQISNAEMEVMLAVWNMGRTVTSADVIACLDRKDWKKTSVLTFLSRLVDKGYLSCQKEGRVNYYAPRITYEEFSKKEERMMLKKLYHNSVKMFVSTLYDGKELEMEEIEELKTYLDSLEKGRRK